jgi:hypothetical protein
MRSWAALLGSSIRKKQTTIKVRRFMTAVIKWEGVTNAEKGFVVTIEIL